MEKKCAAFAGPKRFYSLQKLLFHGSKEMSQKAEYFKLVLYLFKYISVRMSREGDHLYAVSHMKGHWHYRCYKETWESCSIHRSKTSSNVLNRSSLITHFIMTSSWTQNIESKSILTVVELFF